MLFKKNVTNTAAGYNFYTCYRVLNYYTFTILFLLPILLHKWSKSVCTTACRSVYLFTTKHIAHHVTVNSQEYTQTKRSKKEKRTGLLLRIGTRHTIKDTGTKCRTPFSFVMLNYFRANQYEEPWLLVAWSCTLKYEYWIEVNYDWRRTPLH